MTQRPIEVASQQRRLRFGEGSSGMARSVVKDCATEIRLKGRRSQEPEEQEVKGKEERTLLA